MYLRRWFSYVWKHKSYLTIAFLALLAGMAIDAVWPKAVGVIIDDFLVKRVLQAGKIDLPLMGDTPLVKAFIEVLCTLLALLAVKSVSTYALRMSLTTIGEKVHLDIRQELFDHLQRLPISYFDNTYTGRIMARVTTDADALWHLLFNGIIDIVGKLLLTLVVLVILFRTNAPLTLFTLAILPPLFFFSYYTRQKAKVAVGAQREAVATIYTRLQEIISGIRLVRFFAKGNMVSDSFSKDLHSLYDCNMKQMHVYSTLNANTDFLTGAVTAAILCFGGIAVVKGNITVGDLVSFYLYAGILLTPLGVIVRTATEQLTNAGVAMERIFSLLDTPVSVELVGLNEACPRLTGQIKLNNVSFEYQKGHPILENIDLDVNSGEMVALVGPSGAGKSTLVNLICRFFHPTSGSILTDDRNIDDFEVESYRAQISYVSQENFVFSGTIKDNLIIGKPNATQGEVESAAKRANAHDFIMSLPNGYMTEVGERGVMLSGGQRQRLTIARALLRDPAILILDEPTSALDAESEAVILEALETLFKGTTVIIIAHRLSTILSADKILVMDKGRVVQSGNHSTLVSTPGLYRELCRRQFIEAS